MPQSDLTNLKAALLRKTENSLAQFVRYAMVGGTAAVLDTGCLYLLYQFGMNHFAAAAVGFLVGLLANYLLSILWVFQSSGNVRQELALFSIIGIGGLGWTELILWVVVNVANGPVLLGKGISLVLVLVWNFWMRKKFVFKKK
ncbi:MAG TPA: GtrA family protein [Bdellovibrionales bacterium]|nr:MAG: hypothetical protein A2Z97_01400 [Bdellovibrionales bacterium GWB1_52_6]OFZ04989.1 MAG: hypothetical protein A2X97_00110 [Bdellovibrionales bacterium GWA1_52_35]OFZ40300.1 MAG: hypothetical protein A2070_10925 [Bdellovibrionales bacterium GWC1_52_8]HAR42967.1 GtrA family protein [Bdellovibrionales bacterium]HCM41218.1 GtrA family protein [Bdellovibrionales bacterium]